MFTVTDLKQYTYCPRIVYYHHCLPAVRPVTYKMEAGVEAGSAEETRELRRSLRPYGLGHGERHLDVWLRSESWGLRGRADLVIDTDDNASGRRELIPVDFKFSPGRLGANIRLQLLAYGVLVEEASGTISRVVHLCSGSIRPAAPPGNASRSQQSATMAYAATMRKGIRVNKTVVEYSAV